MAKAYSEDLRSRVVKNYLNGMPKIDVIAILLRLLIVVFNQGDSLHKKSLNFNKLFN